MQTLRPATTRLEAPRKFIYNDHLPLANNIFFVVPKKRLRTNSSFEMVDIFDPLFSIDIFNTQKLFCFVDAFFGNLHGFEFLVNRVVLAFFEL